MTVVRADAVVIGAGAGGRCAVARRSHAGLHTMVVDDQDRIGRRASTEEIDGFKVNIGAIAIELGGVFEETFNTVGAALDIRTPEPASSFFIDGKLIDVGRGGWSLLLGQLTKQASRILEKFADARAGNLPDGRQSTEDWLKTYTSNASVHAIFRNLCTAIFACNAAELPARAVLTYFTAKGAFKRFGFCPQGTIGVWNALATAIKRNGEIWLATPAVAIHSRDGRAEGVSVIRDGQTLRIDTDRIISNAGPKTTVALGGEAFPSDYIERVRNGLRPAANIVINIASQQPLIYHPGIVTFGKTRRLCNMANLSATCPELAPPGWHLYVAYAVPVPALGDFDSAAEVELALADLREQFPNFGQARILSTRVMRDDWPAQRSCAGYDLPRETGIEGLWCVGDAVKEYGNGGTQACAETAKIVTDAILEDLHVGLARNRERVIGGSKKMNPASIIRRSGEIYAGNVAVWFEGKQLTYAELLNRAIRLSNVIRDAGAGPGDRVAVLGDNAFETVEQAAACALGNNPRATLYTYHAPSVNRYLLELTGTRVLLVQAKYYNDLAPLLTDLESLKTIIVFDGPAPARTLDYEAAVASASPEDRLVPVRDDDVHIIRFSSGTTGKPKGIYHTVGRWRAFNNEWRWATPMIDETSRYLVPCALAHLGVSLLWGFLMVGGRIVPMPVFDAARALELIESEKITHAVVVPIMIRGMVSDLTARTRDMSALKCLMYAGSPIAMNTLKEAIEVFGPTLFQLYGQSEAVPATMLLPHQHCVNGSEAELRRLRSAGRATGNVSVTIRDEQGNIVPAETIGEIACLGPSTMSGLWNDPEGTAARILPDGSVLTRDMGFVDKDGFVYLVDRKDDMIVSGGYNIWPSELEEALSGHPDVAEVSVFGVPDEKWGETPKAVVVLKMGARASEEELIAHAREIVGSVKKVTSVDFVEALPKTASGKILRGELKAPYWKDRENRVSGS